MVFKAFESSVPFHEIQTGDGSVWLPLITIKVIPEQGIPMAIPVVFDTGATGTVLRAEYAPLFGAATWTEGDEKDVVTAAGPVKMYRFEARLEIFRRQIQCPVYLAQLSPNAVFAGLLGREHVFEHFGFGFWEKDREILVTTQP